MTPPAQSRQLRVQFSTKDDPQGNPFLRLLVASIPDVAVEWFSWRRVLFGRYDILHVHWPDYLFRGGSGLKSAVKQVLGAALLIRLRLLRTPVVWTVHNLEPHEAGNRLEERQMRVFNGLVSFRIYLNESPENDLARGAVILHGRYEVTTSHARAGLHSTVELTYFGLVRPYKGIEALVAALHSVDDDRLRLLIAGRAVAADYGDGLARLIKDEPRIRYLRGHIAESELSQRLSETDLVVLPYRRMYNSGAVLLALEHAVPVLAPDSPSNRALREEVGARWMHLFAGELTAHDLDAALRGLSAMDDSSVPNLSRRRWSQIGALHAELYSILASLPRSATRDEVSASAREAVAATPAFVDHSPLNGSRGVTVRESAAVVSSQVQGA